MSPTHALLRRRPHSPPVRRREPLAIDEGLDWEASGWAGIAGGAAFILIETSFVSMFDGGSNVDPIRQIAAIALGESVLPEPTTFTGLVFLAATGVHLILSLLYARILAVIVHGQPLARAVSLGAGFGAILYGVNYYAFTGLFPWFEVSRGWVTLFAHVSFGMIVAYVYERLTAPARHRLESPTIF